jgi:7,8-dihydropterin-6-yl-methyl-4-(beta-D-ribofuranosyl)aminobenzene 5'-phosphate synthase
MIGMNELDRVEVLTLLDNYIDMTAQDNSDMIQRGGGWKKGEVRKSILSEHGFSAVIRTTQGERTRAMIFDFGFSEIGAAYNARVLGVAMGEIEAIALSHGHGDHRGGFRELVGMIGKPGIEFVAHPSVFKEHRYAKVNKGEFKAWHPAFTRKFAEEAQTVIVETKEPRLMLGRDVLFLGEVPRRTDFEMGLPTAFYEENGVEKKDDIEDDTSLVMNLRGKGLIVLSGCAHSGIINTVRRAQEVTGIETVYAIMGGFHLGIPSAEPTIGRTIDAFLKIDPRYIVPTHCTGRRSIQKIEAAMPDRFILNMSGTRLTFAA